MEKRYAVKLNSTEKIEELLQETYDEACRQLKEINSEMSKLMNNVNLGNEEMSMEEKAKYAKAIHDYLGDKDRAIKTKLDISKFMGEVLKFKGNIDEAVNDPTFAKSSSMSLKSLKATIDKTLKDDGGSTSYNLKK